MKAFRYLQENICKLKHFGKINIREIILNMYTMLTIIILEIIKLYLCYIFFKKCILNVMELLNSVSLPFNIHFMNIILLTNILLRDLRTLKIVKKDHFQPLIS